MSNPSAAPNQAKYFAFLSYAHKDAQTAAALSRYIETFRVPVRLGGKKQGLPKRMFPVFRDRDEFSASSDLGAAIEDALASSGALIVLCSPAAAQSKWVNEEIRTFRRLRNSNRIFPVLLEGEPSEAFPPALTEGNVEPLAVDFRPHQDSLRDARLRLAAALLGVDFDALKKRERVRIRNQRLRIVAVSACLAVVVATTAYTVNLPHITEYRVPTPKSEPWGIVKGPDGALWFTERTGKKIARISTQGRVIEYSISSTVLNRVGPISDRTVMLYRSSVPIEPTPMGVAATQDICFAEYGANGIGCRSIDGQMFGEFIPTTGSGATGIVGGRNNALWFTESKGNKIGSVSDGGWMSEYRIPTTDSEPHGIAVDSDGRLWFTESKGDRIGVLVNIWFTEFPVPTARSGPEGIAVAPDGMLWFTEYNANQIGHLVWHQGALHAGLFPYRITEYRIPTANSGAASIVAGPDGAMWFTESKVGRIGRITTEGRITEYRTPTADSGPEGIVAGPDGALWFTEYDANQIGRITTGHWLFGH